MDRIRLSNNVWYPVEKVSISKDDLLITFPQNVYPKTIPKDVFTEIRIEDRRGRLLNRLKGYDTVISVTENSILLRRIIYTDAQVAQQATTDADLDVIETQQSVTDADTEAIQCQQDTTDTDIGNITSQQDLTDVDVGQIEQAQVTTEMELELLLGV
ncbi:MAG: hypothetical protein E7290_12560 [Lachnospiraceae bacterium]|nr:hypothetical protein [Lachnospiraceae bacterium]